MTIALTMLHAGGKFGGGGYKVSGGLHGVGVSVVNALSSQLIAEVRNRGHLWRQTFTLGVPDGDLVRGPPAGARRAHRHHDHLLGLPRHLRDHDLLPRDDHLAASASTPSSTRASRSSCATSARRPTSSSTPSRTSTIDNDVDQAGHRRDPHGRGRRPRAGLQVRPRAGRLRRAPQPAQAAGQPHGHLLRGRDARTTSGNHMSLEVAMQWNTTFSESVHTFANTINTHEGGTHEEGFRAALTSLVNNWGFEWGLMKKPEDRVSGDDIREGLTAIISIKLGEPQFEGQTKTKLGNTEAKGFVQRIVNDQLGAWLEQNPAEGKDIVRKSPGRPAGPARGPQGARPGPRRARGCSAAAACPASCRTASRPTPRSARSSSSRATRPAARPGRAATRGSRRSSRSAARSSTSRRPASTRCWPTPRSRRSSPRSAPASTRSSTSTSCATTRSC